MATRHRRHRRTALAITATLLTVTAAAGCSALDKTLDCVRTADAIATSVDNLQQAVANASSDPTQASESLDEIEKELGNLGDKTDDADLTKAVDDLQAGCRQRPRLHRQGRRHPRHHPRHRRGNGDRQGLHPVIRDSGRGDNRPMTRLILATRNAGKITELHAILADAGLTYELVGADAYPEIPDVKETGVTFAENALLKAHALAQATGHPAIADDSGLCVDVLGGAPGIFSARWAGTHGNDRANLDLLLAQLSDIDTPHRAAHFACAAALALPDGTERVVEGRLLGTLRHTPSGTGGFGYDPILQPEGETRTCAELTPAEKNAISHRGKAFRGLVSVVRELVG